MSENDTRDMSNPSRTGVGKLLCNFLHFLQKTYRTWTWTESREEAAAWLMSREVRFVLMPVIVEATDITPSQERRE